MADPFTCVRCAAVNPTCCRMDSAAAESCFPLSEAEAARIKPFADALSLPAGVEETNTRHFIRVMRTLFPDRQELVATRFPEGKNHLRLPLNATGACVFLQDGGCCLPRHARPWYCQLFPIWIRKGFFDYFNAASCLIAEEARSMRDIFASSGLTPEEARELYLSLCRDWGLARQENGSAI